MDTSCGQASGTVVIYSDYSMNMFRQHPEIRKIAGTGSRKSNLYFPKKKNRERILSLSVSLGRIRQHPQLNCEIPVCQDILIIRSL
jgi:hypothetical protein